MSGQDFDPFDFHAKEAQGIAKPQKVGMDPFPAPTQEQMDVFLAHSLDAKARAETVRKANEDPFSPEAEQLFSERPRLSQGIGLGFSSPVSAPEGVSSVAETEVDTRDTRGPEGLSQNALRVVLGLRGQDPQGQLNALAETFGPKNVGIDRGEIVFRENEDGKFRQWDPSSISDIPTDVAELAFFIGSEVPGRVLSAMGIKAAGKKWLQNKIIKSVGAGLAKESARSTGGAVSRNAIEAGMSGVGIIPGDSSSLADRALDVGVSGALGTGFEAGRQMFQGARAAVGAASSGLSQAVDDKMVGAAASAESIGLRDRPNVMAARRYALKTGTEPQTTAAQNRSTTTGMGGKPNSQVTENVESFGRNNPLTQGIFLEADAKNSRSQAIMLNRLIKRVSPNSPSSDELGRQISSRFKGVVKDLQKKRRDSFQASLAKVDEATSGQDIPIESFKDELQRIANEASPIESTSGANAIRQKAKKMLKQIQDMEEPPILTEKQIADGMVQRSPVNGVKAKQLGTMLSDWTEGSRQGANVIEGVETGSAPKAIAMRLKKALDADLDAAANSIEDPAAAQLLRDARSTYARHSQEIAGYTDSTIGEYLSKMTGTPDVNGEAIFNKLVVPQKRPTITGMQKQASEFLRKHDPEKADELFRAAIEGFMGDMKSSGRLQLSPAKAVSSWDKWKHTISSLSGPKDAGTVRRLKEFVAIYGRRNAQKGLLDNPSGTGKLNAFFQGIKSFKEDPALFLIGMRNMRVIMKTLADGKEGPRFNALMQDMSKIDLSKGASAKFKPGRLVPEVRHFMEIWSRPGFKNLFESDKEETELDLNLEPTSTSAGTPGRTQ